LFTYFTSVLAETEAKQINKAMAKTEKGHGNGVIVVRGFVGRGNRIKSRVFHFFTIFEI